MFILKLRNTDSENDTQFNLIGDMDCAISVAHKTIKQTQCEFVQIIYKSGKVIAEIRNNMNLGFVNG